MAEPTAFGSSLIFILLAGTFGGLLPFFYDVIQRQKTQAERKIVLNCEFFIVKGLLIPCLATAVNYFAAESGSVNNWLAALYLGASLPILIEKIIGASAATAVSLNPGQ